MKKLLNIVIISLMFISGCNNPFTNERIGVECDKDSAIKLAQDIINNSFAKGDLSIKIDRNNIIEWDYKNGRYLCRAKIEGTYNKKISYIKQLALEKYGFKFDSKTNKVSGWILYQTYLPTVEIRKLKNGKEYSFYVEILDSSKLPQW